MLNIFQDNTKIESWEINFCEIIIKTKLLIVFNICGCEF